jgi:hypothetical protein
MLELLIFTLATLIYFAGRYYITKPSYVRLMIGAYIAITFMSQFFFNITHLSKLCVGASNFGKAVLVTVIPYILIFGTIITVLMMFPGWKQPFSNTFGYGVAKIMGVNSILFKLLKSASVGDTNTKKMLHNIYTNPALFINEITPTNFDDFVKNSNFLFVSGASSKPEMQQLKNIIRLKDIVSEFVWYILSGMLVSTVSYNTIVNSGCTNSVKEMKKRHDEYEEEVTQKAEAAKSTPPPRVYYIRD